METQTVTTTERQTSGENAKVRFIRKTRELFARETDLDKRWNGLRPILAELLADPDMIAASKTWPDCVPANGRAENLRAAVLAHFGEAVTVRSAFLARPAEDQEALVVFLEDL